MERSFRLDLMRLFGLLLIILAHIGPPNAWFQIRTFDVPMMVFVSGVAYSISSSSFFSWRTYYIKRVSRLLFPVWCFFVLFYGGVYIFNIKIFSLYLKWNMIFSTFLLNGFGYLWIIRVFIIIAILAPFMVILFRTKTFYFDVSIVILSIIVSTITSYYFIHISNKYVKYIVVDLILPALIYSSLFILGYKWHVYTRANKNTIGFIFLIFLMVAQAYMLFKQKGIIQPQDFKYPPTIIYVSFSIVMIIFLDFILESCFDNTASSKHKFVIFLSSNTIWVYLWHIPIVEFFKLTDSKLEWYMKYIFVVFISFLITFLQVNIIKWIVRRNPRKLKFLKVIFTG
uniref:Predicted acyltransferase n=2 Tax=Escherichia albertii TaxID=208962 RepID=A0A5A4U4X8_ESCAL|nr:predicted acyltransferase [Escherichia albertii]